MSEQNQNDDQAQDSQGEMSGEQGENQQGPVPYDRFQQVIQERNQTRQRLRELEQAQRQADEDAARESGEFERLYTEAQPRLEQLAAYEAAVGEMLAARLEQASEALQALVPEGSPLTQLQWLERAAAAGILGPQPPTRSGPGVPPSGPRQPPLPTITRSQMSDPAWVREHKLEIRQAAKENRLER